MQNIYNPILNIACFDERTKIVESFITIKSKKITEILENLNFDSDVITD